MSISIFWERRACAMEVHILAIGDVVGEPGLSHLEKTLRPVKKLKNIAFTVVNGENAAGTGLTPQQAQRIYYAGADVITLGNHTFDKPQIADFLDDAPYILRPANFSGRAPGRGWGVYDCNGWRVRVINLIGRCDLAWNADNPFTVADKILKQDAADFTLVDFHAQATSEKLAMGDFLDGRVSALWGTHTHVPTSDERVYPKGSGYISDVGMTGPVESVLGVDPAQSVEGFLGGLSGRFQVPEGPCKMQGAIFSLDSKTGLCLSVERIDIR
jgi:metallophosphoesterase (TIGR00282 family)